MSCFWICIRRIIYFYVPAYEDKKHSKRQQISSRSWFSSPSLTAGAAAGGLLQKLGQQGRGAAVAKALGSTTSSSHILVRRKSEGGKADNNSAVNALAFPLDISPGDFNNTTKDRTRHTNDVNDASAETKKGGTSENESEVHCGTAEVNGTGLSAAKGLVVAYSDSDSDSNSEL